MVTSLAIYTWVTIITINGYQMLACLCDLCTITLVFHITDT
ncbi:hypothetical protein VR7878_02169 [Vibrio ruber DSM 16370]|uniref:Uncharacterized protein n=1 Tax=Vibrio ruber (strain DSM 16370 / JCM 11486 / BCRC 17186 / CECT 7878 / LMG 23124 / VR1) TaxID=1123498 RepID=A0A1R4LL51_VIBR1|nr:hypothetical protein VR7878_02169 [Vibrio ruber DSM 16370]